MAVFSTSHDLDIDGLNLHAEVAGSGPPIVLVHGFTGTGASWRSLVEALAPDCTTIAVDLVGHGRSGCPEALDRYQMRRAVDDLAVMLHALGHDRATWLGYSLGGRVALQVAVHRPDVVDALVLESATPGIATAEEREARIAADEALAQKLEREGLEAFVNHWQSIALWDSQQRTLTDDQRAALRRGRLAQNPRGLALSLRGMGTGSQPWVGDRLGEVRVPVLLTAGTLDTKFSAIAREMASSVPTATMQLIDDAGHAAHLERPDAFHAMVREFLTGVRARVS
ncbi:MAG: 2-succinyl-6-hydroxy-2,4-cyclohexadiene-1-carboxylate synthase [Chloroflexi bacterium]|nr:MAG: 2-succinyl-6-hydroxy-2,4-cyclohexadiene-1-carboxylate synthase [Chloroflexota bacterium]